MDFYLNLNYKDRAGRRINDGEHGLHDDISFSNNWLKVKDSFSRIIRPMILSGDYPEHGAVVEETYKDGTKHKNTIQYNGNLRLEFETHNGTSPGCTVHLTPQEAKELGDALIGAAFHEITDEKGIRQYAKLVSAPKWIDEMYEK
jgi:hypothetical protein